MGSKTCTQAKLELRQRGVSIAEWARDNGFTYSQVADVLNGRAKGHRGISHRVAVRLGIKAAQRNNGRREARR